MSDYDQTSLHDELEVRVIALLTGELGEAEADELEKILAINPELSAYRDRMAELMGELHQARDEIAPPSGERPLHLSEERRAQIFGDTRVLEAKSKQKRIWMNPALWGVAASIAVVFAFSLLSTIKFQSAVMREVHVFESMPVSVPAQKEPAYTVNMEQRNQSTPAARPPAMTVSSPTDLEIPALDIDVNADSSSVYGRSGGSFGGGLSGVREMALAKDSDHEGKAFAVDQVEVTSNFGKTIPVDIPKELIEGTPQPILVPNLERRATKAPRMVVRPESELGKSYGLGGNKEGGLSVQASDMDLTFFGDAADSKQNSESEKKLGDDVASPGRDNNFEKRSSGDRSVASSGPVDPFAAPKTESVSSRAVTDERRYRSDAYASSGPVDAFAAPARKKQREDVGGVADLNGSERDEIIVLNGNIASSDGIVLGGSFAGNYSGVDGFAAQSTGKPKGQVSTGRQSEVAQLSKRGRAHFLNGDYDAAEEVFEEVSGIDPGNSDANLFAWRIDSIKEEISAADGVKSREQMLTEVGQAWERPKVFDVQSESSAVAASSLAYKPQAIVIPQVNFSGMPLSRVVETLEELSAVYDPEGTGVSLEYKPVNGHDPKVNISLRNLNLERILQFVTQQVNYEFVDMHGEFIRIQPSGQSAVEQVAENRAKNVRQTPKPEKLAAEEPFSTFSLNISDVSFKLAQAALQNSRVPPAAQIRTEEFVNSFDYGDPSPRSDEPVALHWEMAQHPFEHDRQVVRFSLQTQASGRTSGQALNISLLVDNSGSMQRPDRQAILQNSLQTLEQKLTPQDNLNIILFARQPRLIAEAQTRASQKAAVETALAYRPEGGTNLEAGLHAAYESARRNFVSSGSNRVILMTDGAANLGNVNAGDLAEYVVEQRKQGIALDAYGIGWDDYNDALLEEITRNGDGRYAFLNSVEDASDDFSEKLAGTLRVAASNVKVQIEWNPDRVQRYRQIGYDLHQLKKEDFRDNTVDAAEIGEAESGTALYVMKINDDPKIIGGLGTLHVRYLDPASGLYKEYSWPLPMPRQVKAANAASPSMRLAMSSAFFGERLAASPYAGGYNFNDLYRLTSGLPEAFPNQPRVNQMQSMLLQASELYGENK